MSKRKTRQFHNTSLLFYVYIIVVEQKANSSPASESYRKSKATASSNAFHHMFLLSKHYTAFVSFLSFSSLKHSS